MCFYYFMSDFCGDCPFLDINSDVVGWLYLKDSKVSFPMVPTVQDRIVTLSTCSSSYLETRFVLLGVIR